MVKENPGFIQSLPPPGQHVLNKMRKISLIEKVLCTALIEMDAGLFNADLGGNILKKRIA